MPGTADLHIMREREVIDVGGTHLGRAEDLYADERTGEAVFLLVSGGRFGTKLHFVPVEGAEIEGEKIRVAFTADQVNNAPNISADESLSPSEEEQLFHHYGMDGHDGETTILVVWVATG
jgi:sporulation protein YlmC with PRC-barrel domain